MRNRRRDGRKAVLVIDMINDLEFEGGERLLVWALPIADHIAALARRARAAGIPVIYVNDNFGRWESDFRDLIERSCREGARGRPIVERVKPEPDDYYVLKPKHSGFFGTSLDILLEQLDVGTLILTGVAANICVLFTANDAYMREYDLIVPADCIAAEEDADYEHALAEIAKVLKADTRRSTGIDLDSPTGA
jgi:nicotinamidase-related amidase